MAACLHRNKKELKKRARAILDDLEKQLMDAINKDKEVLFTQEAGMHDVSDGTPFKKTAPNGTYRYTVDIGPYWTQL